MYITYFYSLLCMCNSTLEIKIIITNRVTFNKYITYYNITAVILMIGRNNFIDHTILYLPLLS